jgi:glycosyltransferase involved in cell wall biosynthesis
LSTSISIALCTYNGALYLREQLDTIAKQSVRPIEIVLCDDGSSDSTLDIVEEFSRTSPFPVRVFRNAQNLGYSKNFEKAIGLCVGNFIALSDQDDLWYPHKLATLSSLLENDISIGGVFSDGDVIASNARKTGITLWRKFAFNLRKQNRFRSGDAIDVLLQRNVVTGMTMMFRASLREKVLPIPQSWIHDSWLAWMLILNSKLVPCSGCLVGYRSHQQQQLGTPLSERDKIRKFATQGISTFLEKARAVTIVEHQQFENQFSELINRIHAMDIQDKEVVVAKANEKAKFSREVMAALADSRGAHICKLARQAPKYRRYTSRGIIGMLRDMII